jgi:hypothetical protein
MSEKVLKIPLEDLETLRITCKGKECGVTIEVPLQHVGALLGKGGVYNCHNCNAPFYSQRKTTETNRPFDSLAETISILKGMNEKVKVEFVLKVKD